MPFLLSLPWLTLVCCVILIPTWTAVFKSLSQVPPLPLLRLIGPFIFSYRQWLGVENSRNLKSQTDKSWKAVTLLMKRQPLSQPNLVIYYIAVLTYIFIDGLKHFGKTMIILAYPLETYCPIVPIILISNARIPKRCPENISSVVRVSKCSF